MQHAGEPDMFFHIGDSVGSYQEQWYRFKWSSTFENKDDVPKAAGTRTRSDCPEKAPAQPTEPGDVAPAQSSSSSSSSKQRAPEPQPIPSEPSGPSMQQKLQTAPSKDGWGAKNEITSNVVETDSPKKVFKLVNEKTIELNPTMSHVVSGERSVSSLPEAMSFFDDFLNEVIQ